MPWVIGAAAVVFLVVLVVVATSGSRNTPAPPRRDLPPPAPAPIAAPAPAKPTPDNPVEKARAALQEARDYSKRHADDLRGQLAIWDKALWSAEGTPHFDEAKKEVARLKALRGAEIEKQLKEIDAQIEPLLARESFKQVIDLLKAARQRDDSPQWRLPLDRRIAKARAAVSSLFASARDEAVQAQKSGASGKLKAVAQRVEKWGFAEFSAALPRAEGTSPPAGETSILIADDFEGTPRFDDGTVVAGRGVNGSSALSFPDTGAYLWLATEPRATATCTIRFWLKSEGEVDRINVLLWSKEGKDNARIVVKLKKGEWVHYEGKIADFRFFGGQGDRLSGKRFQSVKFDHGKTKGSTVLLDNFVIRR